MPSTRTAARALAVTAVLALVAVLLWFLPKSGYSHLRLALFAGLAGSAATAGAGVLRESSRLVAVGVVGLVLLGVWQAVLWVFVLPVAGALVVASLLAPGARDGSGTP
jgi:hypothetical protein